LSKTLVKNYNTLTFMIFYVITVHIGKRCICL